jgi:signal peptidase II
LIYAIATVIVLILDQLLKLWTTSNIELSTGYKDLIPGVLGITNYHNYGIAFGLGSGNHSLLLRWLMVVLVLAFSAVIVVLLVRKKIIGSFGRWSAVCVLAGALGNGIDRAVHGFVVDMIEFQFIDFAIFNLADAFITVGALLFCVYIIVHKDQTELGSGAKAQAVDTPREPPVSARKASAPPPAHARRASASPSAPHANIEQISRPDMDEMTGRLPSVASIRLAQEQAARGREPLRRHVQARPAQPAPTPVQYGEEQSRPAASSAPPVRQAPPIAPIKPASVFSDGDFSLEDILNEFRD